MRATTTTTTPLGGGHWLRTDAAQAYQAMRAAGCPAGITSSTRTYDKQRSYYENQGRPGWPALADHPDRSKHVWRPGHPCDAGARALDLPDIGGAMNPAVSPRAWVRAHGARFGWMKDRVRARDGRPLEPWHMEFEPWNADVRHTSNPVSVITEVTIPTPGRTLPDPLEEDEMSVETVRTALAELLQEAADRSTPTGRSVGDSLAQIVSPSVWAFLLDGRSTASAFAASTNRIGVENRATLARVLELLSRQSSVDPGDVARALAPLLVEPVVAGIGADLGLTLEQIEDATEKAVRTVLGGG